jgi:thiosulfate dehydrogenase
MSSGQNNIPDELYKVIKTLLIAVIILVITLLLLPIIIYKNDSIKIFISSTFSSKQTINSITTERTIDEEKNKLIYWVASDISEISDKDLREKILYGKELIAHTAKYLGPKGTLLQISNGMNCQNCHLDAGTKVYGNNYGSVYSMYPKFRARSGSTEDIYKRVNDCFERSLNGKKLDTLSNEMQAVKAYIEYIGSNVNKGEKAIGSGLKDLKFMDRACDTLKGNLVYKEKCQSCHQQNGEGLLSSNGLEYTYPPLWGKHSYNDGAGLFRISNYAKYVKYNMPLGVTHDNTQLTDEEAWDVAAFINSQSRKHFINSSDWPDISKKPIDHPFGPYTDSFSEQQHKYGPYKPIADFQKNYLEKEKNKKSVAN